MSERDDRDPQEGDRTAWVAATARDYDAAWAGRLGLAAERSVDRLELAAGHSVLDVACGTGGAAVIAAKRVGLSGQVLAVDLSPDMLAIGREKAEAEGLTNLTFDVGNMTGLPYVDGRFDAVMCVLGLFFVDDMVAQVSELWRLVRPGGRLVVTTIGPQWFSPMSDVLIATALAEDPDAWVDFANRRTSDPDVVAQIMAAGGVPGAAVTVEHNMIPLSSPDDWWQIVMGTILHRTVLSLGPAAAARVRARNLAWISEQQCHTVSLDFIYAVAKRP